MSTTGIHDGQAQRLRDRAAATTARLRPRRGGDQFGTDPGRGRLRSTERNVAALIAGSPAEERRILLEARRRGRRAVQDRVFDPWTLARADRIPYFSELAGRRDRERRRLMFTSRQLEERIAVEQERLRGALAQAEKRRDHGSRQLDAAEEQRARTARRLDRVAAHAERWERLRDLVYAGFERKQLDRQQRLEQQVAAAQAGQYGSEGAAAALLGPDWESIDREDGPDEPARPGSARIAQAAHLTGPMGQIQALPEGRWSGEWEGQRPRAGISVWTRRALLLILTTVELPIYLSIFRYFHGTGVGTDGLLTPSLTFGVAVLMIAVPHVVGRMLRERLATGSSQFALPVSAGLTTGWAYACYFLGNLRSKALLAQSSTSISNLPAGMRAPSLAQRLNLDPHTMTIMFMVLLLLSGGLSLLLGLGDEHPFLAAYRSAQERAAQLRRALEQHEASLAEATEALEAAQARRSLRDEGLHARLEEIGDLYESAAHAYLDGIITTAGDTAITEAALMLDRTGPLLPRTSAG